MSCGAVGGALGFPNAEPIGGGLESIIPTPPIVFNDAPGVVVAGVLSVAFGDIFKERFPGLFNVCGNSTGSAYVTSSCNSLVNRLKKRSYKKRIPILAASSKISYLNNNNIE